MCGSVGQRERPSGAAPWRLYHCLSCDVEHFSPARNPGHEWYEDSDIYTARDLDIVDWLAWYHRAALEIIPVTAGRLIDVGCGNGAFVAAARDRGFDAVGVDFSERAIESGKRTFGAISLYALSAERALKELPAPFDVVTAFETLEHMDDPRAFLAQLTALVAPGGWVVISLPNRARRPFTSAHGDVPPHHFTRWSALALRNALTSAGLEVHHIRISPAQVTIKIYLLELVRSGVVRRMLAPERPTGSQRAVAARARGLIVLKDRLADAGASALAPIAAPLVKGAMMVALARRPADVRS